MCFSSLGRVCLVVVVVVVVGWLQFSNSWPCSVYLSCRSTAKDVVLFFRWQPILNDARAQFCVCVSFLVIGVDHTRDSFRFFFFFIFFFVLFYKRQT